MCCHNYILSRRFVIDIPIATGYSFSAERMFFFILLLCINGALGSHYNIIVNSSAPGAINNPSCWTNPPCLSLTLGLQGVRDLLGKNHSNITLVVASGRYNLSEISHTSFENVTGISIIGSPSVSPPSTVVSCIGSVGFSFIYSSDITIHGIEFSNCNQIRNSTSFKNDTDGYQFEKIYVGLYLLYCTDINLRNISVNGSSGIGLTLYNPAGTVVIEQSGFYSNSYESAYFNNNLQQQQQQLPTCTAGGGGIYIEFSYCVPYGEEAGSDCLRNGISNVDPFYTSDTSIMIVNCHFYKNKASGSCLGSFYALPSKQYHLGLGKGGGLSMFFKGDARRNDVLVKRCHFEQNSALWGGGIFAEFHDNASFNNLTISFTSLNDNSVYLISNNSNSTIKGANGGGGSSVGFIYFKENSVHGNMILYENCSFTKNTAFYGGAISFYSPKQVHNINSLNAFTIHDCSIKNNRAKFGSAIDITLWQPSADGHCPRIIISDCVFTGNDDQSLHQNGLIGLGAIYIESILVVFSHDIIFSDNRGSAMSITSSSITIENDATVSFIGNQGRNGGAISLLSASFITTGYNSSLQFINNTADYNGGAIYYFSSGEKNFLSSHNCLFRYQDIAVSPEQWTSNFYFEGNKANGLDNAIHTPSLFPCVWKEKSNLLIDYDSDEIRRVFCWNSNWKYINSTINERDHNCHSYITTAPARYELKQTRFETYPGGLLHLNVSVYDDLGNNVTDSTVFLANILNDSASFNGYSYRYISRGYFVLNGQSSDVNIQLLTPDPIVISKDLTVTLRQCPPAFELDDTGSCVCAGDYNGFVNCDPLTTTTSISSSIWLGTVEINGQNETLAGLSPFVSNPTDMFPADTTVSEFLCGGTNREGILCGSCKPGFGIAVNSNDFKCVPCAENQAAYSWIFYLLTEFFLLTIFCLVIFVFGITVTWGPLNAYIYYSQVLPNAVSVDADGTIPYASITNSYNGLKALYTIPYDVWNLNFLRPIMPEYCLSQNINAIELLALGYLTALYPLLLLIICVGTVQAYSKGFKPVVYLLRPFQRCLIHIRKLGNFRQSVTGGIAAFIVISYTKFCSVSLYMLTPIPLYQANGSTAKMVFYFNGNIAYTAEEGIGYILMAFIVLLTFVGIPPLLLIYPSVLRLTEKLTKRQLGRFYPPAKLQVFLDEFHGCFKDGTADNSIDSQWFAGLYFYLRIAMYIVYSYTPMWGIHFVAQLMVFIIAAALFVLFRPYRKDWINTLDIMIFLLLSAITSLSQFNILLTWLNIVEGKLVYSFVVQYVLIFIPLFYFLIYHGFFLAKKFKNHYSDQIKTLFVRQKERDRKDEFVINETYDHHDKPGLVDSTHVANFLDYIDEGREEEEEAETRNTITSTSEQKSESTGGSTSALLYSDLEAKVIKNKTFEDKLP